MIFINTKTALNRNTKNNMRKSPNDALLLVTFEFEANAIYEMIKYSDGTTDHRMMTNSQTR